MPQVPYIERGPDNLRILITTDNHIGYNENDAIRGDDSWRTFEEIMNIASEQDVDMVLQCGDLFHINKPTKKSMFHVIRILRRKCFGDKPVELEMLSSPSTVFDDSVNCVNYEDPNLNISIPVFAISGNHDDASGSGMLSPLDLLSMSGLINHFGRVIENDLINVIPIFLQKGTTKLALYGMASVRDERLFRSFQDQKVKFHRPNELTDEWFNLMTVHQNHVKRPGIAYLPEHFLPSFLDLVIWGHEHECIPHTVSNPNAGFETLQPGSSVATSLSESEAIEKKVFILNIENKDYSLESFKLKTIRPFQMTEIILSSIKNLKTGPAYKNEVTQFLISKVDELITKANEDFKQNYPNDDYETPLPLIRLRVDYSGGYEVENPRRFSNRFVGKVANVNSVVQFHKRMEKNSTGVSKRKVQQLPEDEDNDENINIENFISNYLKEMTLSLLPEKGMNNAVKTFVEKEDKSALKEYVDLELAMEEEGFLANEYLNIEENFDDIVKKIKKERDSTPFDSKTNKQIKPTKPKTTTKANKNTKPPKSKEIVESDESELELPPSPKPKRTKKKQVVEVINSDSDFEDMIKDSDEEMFEIDNNNDNDNNNDDDDEFIAKPPPKPKRGRPKKDTTTKTTTKKTTTRKPRSTKETPKTDAIANLLARKKK